VNLFLQLWYSREVGEGTAILVYTKALRSRLIRRLASTGVVTPDLAQWLRLRLRLNYSFTAILASTKALNCQLIRGPVFTSVVK
jgi:hypothetical protein